jgi:hypothetical protein
LLPTGASVSGLSGTGAELEIVVAFKLIGHFSDCLHAASHAFDFIISQLASFHLLACCRPFPGAQYHATDQAWCAELS